MGKKTLYIYYMEAAAWSQTMPDPSREWRLSSWSSKAVSSRPCTALDESSHRLVTRHGASLYPASINYSDATSRRQVVEPQLSMVLWFGGSLRWMRKILGNYRLVSSWVSSFCIHFPSDLYYRIRTALSRGVHSADFIFLYF